MIRQLSTGVLAIAMIFATASVARADASSPSTFCSNFFNGCFYSLPGFNGTEYKTTVYFPGCWHLPDTRSASVGAARPTTLYSGDDCTGTSYTIPAGLGWNPNLGFTARSYYYPPA